MLDIKQKATNEETRRHRQQDGGYQKWGEVVGRLKRVKGVKSMVTEGDWTLGGEHTMPYTDDVL